MKHKVKSEESGTDLYDNNKQSQIFIEGEEIDGRRRRGKKMTENFQNW